MSDLVSGDETDLRVLSQVVADAFIDLPASWWLIADREVRRSVFPGYFQLHVEHALGNGVVHTNADRSAVALWIPVSGEPPSPPEDYTDRLGAVTSPWTERFTQFDEALDRAHPAGASHHHLAILGVRPDRQGEGTGTGLLTGYHQVLDQRVHASAYLEAADQRTRQLYRTHGYADHGPPIQLPGGPPMYPMWREHALFCPAGGDSGCPASGDNGCPAGG